MEKAISKVMELADAYKNTQAKRDFKNLPQARAALENGLRRALQCSGCDVPRDGIYKISEPTQLAAVQHSSDRDSNFFVAGWNARNEGLDPTEQFKRAALAAQAKQGGV